MAQVNFDFRVGIEIERPENFMGKSKNSTINFLEHIKFNVAQLKVSSDYVKRTPKYLFKVKEPQP